MQLRNHENRSRSTRFALERAGRELFAEHGFTAVPAEQLVAVAGVTRGALQYHYADKRGLFVAVLEQLEWENTQEIAAAMAAAPNPDDLLDTLAIGLRTFLDICCRPEMIQIALSDAPAVLGWQAWREFEARNGLGLLTPQLEAARAAGQIPDVQVNILAQLLLSAATEAGMLVAHAPDPAAARDDALQALMTVIAGTLRPREA